MHGIDPYTPTNDTYECPECLARTESRGTCSSCETRLRNISVPRE